MAKKKNTDENETKVIIPMIALEHFVITPEIPQPVKIDDEEQRGYLENCFNSNTKIFIATLDSPDKSEKQSNIKKIGMVCEVDKVLHMPGAPSLAFVRPVSRAQFHKVIYNPLYPMAEVSLLENIKPPKKEKKEYSALLDKINDISLSLLGFLPDAEKETAQKLVMENSKTSVMHLYSITHVAPLSWEEKYKVVECEDFNTLIETVAIILDQADQRIHLQASIHERTHHELSKQQKEAFLRTHLRQIQEELGENFESDDILELSQKAELKKWDNKTKEHFEKELNKLRRLNINSPEYSVQYSYLESFLDLPWLNYKQSKVSIPQVEKILDRDHYGLEKVKERIMEYMAVLKLRNDLKAPIICLSGPPGVGKTSIGKSIAEASGREYARISLGGMHDEAEIRGHRRTYIGAMPGRFLHAISKCKYGNPLILLDEIDKVGKDFKGDPSSALLEALDPEQNNTFHDNFIDYPYDLSKVLFIATANDITKIPAPLRDRLEIIEIAGYTPIEKREIALRHLVDKALIDNGFKKGDIVFTPDSIDKIIKDFTHEKGVRQLSKALNRIIRRIALQKVKGHSIPTEITSGNLADYIDKKDTTYSNLGFKP